MAFSTALARFASASIAALLSSICTLLVSMSALFLIISVVLFSIASAFFASAAFARVASAAIASAFLANCNPVGVIFSSVFIRFLNMGGDYLVKVGFNRYVADIVVAVIIYMAGFTRIIREWLNERLSKKKPEKDIRDTVVTSTKEEAK